MSCVSYTSKVSSKVALFLMVAWRSDNSLVIVSQYPKRSSILKNSRLQAILAILPVVTSGLYLLGFSYHQGYLESFGIEDSLFNLTSDRSMFIGLYTALSLILLPSFYTVIAVFVLFVVVVLVGIFSSLPRVREVQQKVVVKYRWRFGRGIAPNIVSMVESTGTLYFYVVGFFFTCVLLTFIPYFATKSGKEQASKEILEFREKKGNTIILYSSQLPEPMKVKQISCSTSHCAFWNGSEAFILRLDSIERMVTHKSP